MFGVCFMRGLQLAWPASRARGPGRPSLHPVLPALPASSGQAGRVHLMAEWAHRFTVLLHRGWEGNTRYLQPLYLKVGSPHPKTHEVRNSSNIERGLRYLVGWKMINAYPSSYRLLLYLCPVILDLPQRHPVSSVHILLRVHLFHSFMAPKCTSSAWFTSSLW